MNIHASKHALAQGMGLTLFFDRLTEMLSLEETHDTWPECLTQPKEMLRVWCEPVQRRAYKISVGGLEHRLWLYNQALQKEQIGLVLQFLASSASSMGLSFMVEMDERPTYSRFELQSGIALGPRAVPPLHRTARMTP